MKYYVVLSFVIGYLCLTVSGTTGKTFNSATNAETSPTNRTNVEASFTNTTNVEESPNNATNLEESSKNTTDLKVPLQDSFLYVFQTEIEPKLQYEIKSRIMGDFKKTTNQIINIGSYLKNEVNGTESDKTFNGAINAETSSTSTANVEAPFTNATDIEELSNNATNLEESSKNTTDLEIPLQDSFPYTIQNETEPILQHGFKSRITGGIKKITGRIKTIGTKVKNKIKKIGTGGGGSGGGSSNYRIHNRYRKTTGTYSSNLDTSTILYIVFGVIGGVILITIICYFVRA